MATLRSESTSSLSVYSSLESHKHLTPDPHKGPQPLRPIPHILDSRWCRFCPTVILRQPFCFTQQATQSNKSCLPSRLTSAPDFSSICLLIHFPSPQPIPGLHSPCGAWVNVLWNGLLSCRPAFGFPPSVSFLLCPSWITPPHSPRCSLRVVGRNVPGLWPRLRLCPPISTR
jgi:hypothetical protein